MRILFVAPDLAPATGGLTTAVVGLARALAARGVEVAIAATDVGFGGGLDAHGVSLHLHRSPALRARRWAPRLSEFLRREASSFDLAVVHGLWCYPTVAAARAAERARVPYVVVPHGMLEAWSLRQNRLRKAAYLFCVEGRTLRRAAALHASGDGELRNSGLHAWNRSIFVTPWGIPEGPWRSLPDPDRFRHRYPEVRGRRVVLFLGRLHRKKQPDVVIRAFGSTCGGDRDAVLALVGSGSRRYEDRLARLVRELGLEGRVVFTGFLQGPAVREAYAAAELFVLPSWQENFGYSVVEAMAAGCPVVVSDRVGLAPEIAAAGAGLVVPPTVEATAEAMHRLLADDALRREMGAQGRALVLERFTWDRVVDELLVVYDDILSGRRRSSAWRPASASSQAAVGTATPPVG